jgi:hypothetical protein
MWYDANDITYDFRHTQISRRSLAFSDMTVRTTYRVGYALPRTV